MFGLAADRAAKARSSADRIGDFAQRHGGTEAQRKCERLSRMMTRSPVSVSLCLRIFVSPCENRIGWRRSGPCFTSLGSQRIELSRPAAVRT